MDKVNTQEDMNIPFETLHKMSILCALSYLDPSDIVKIKHDENDIYGEETSNLSPRAITMIKNIQTSLNIDDRLSFIDTASIQDGIFAECYTWIKEKERAVYFIIRGTDTIEDWQVNFDLRTGSLTDANKLNIHKGFLRQFQSIEPFMSRVLTEHRSEYDKIIVTGHSLGGSVATIATLHFNEMFAGEVPIYLYTFGCPRVGDVRMNAYFKTHLKTFDACWRVYDIEDPVPMVPVRSEFQHLECNTLCLHDGVVWNTKKKDTRWPYRLLHLFMYPPLLRPASKHDINAYSKNLSKNIMKRVNITPIKDIVLRFYRSISPK